MVLERFAGVQNIYVADENDTIVAAALAVPVTLQAVSYTHLPLLPVLAVTTATVLPSRPPEAADLVLHIQTEIRQKML